MGYVTKEMIDRAKEMDLLTYLQTYEPQELVHFGGSTYCTREHDSLKISNGKWCWFSRGIGGKTALDYLIKVKELPFTEAVERIVGRAAERPSVFHARAQPEKPKTLLLPPESNSNTRVIAYLKSRGIDGGLIEQCIRSGQLYESLPYHNAVFVGMDRDGTPRYACLRGIGTDFKGEATGSDKRFSFALPATGESRMLCVFESAIDLLSYATMAQAGGLSWRSQHLQDMGEKRVALFALIPDSDTSFNFLVSILYQQLFQQLFDSADHKHGGSLPVPVHFLMDEFANISLPNDFEIKLSTMRSRNVFVSIILQNIAQLKALFEKQWESILGNCDELLYLGGNEQGSHKYISELLGKATIDTNTYGRSSGRNGNYSTNYQITGRELMTPDEVRMLDNGKALLFIRGELPVCDDKFDIMTHPLVSHTPDGGAPPYIHGSAEYAIAAITIHDRLLPTDPVAVPSENETQYELLSNEELEAIYELEEKPNEASQKH